MPTNDYSKNIVYLSKEQYQELITNETLTVNGQTITYNDNDIYVTPQAEPITDVRMNGTSISNNGIANIPVAGSGNVATSTLGVVKGGYGVKIDTQGRLLVDYAYAGDVKNGTSLYLPITPSTVPDAAFYGLSKVAGVDLKNETVTLGIYPDVSKAAIQHMLGTDTIIAPNETDPFTSAHAMGDLFTMNGSLYKAKTVITAADAVNVGTNCEVTSISEAFPHDVQVNGISVVSNGVANVPIAINDGDYGLVKVGPLSRGIAISTVDGFLCIYPATPAIIKYGGSNTDATYRAITTRYLPEAAFYGLARAAGDATQSASSNAVGTYTDTAKSAIKTMLGVTDPTVTDVQVNGTSVVSQGVANIPLATDSSPGLLAIYPNGGSTMLNGGLAILPATSEEIKSANGGNPIKPRRQHESVFYGLAKAAGDTTQSASNNAIGTYTAEAKNAIQTMLGIPVESGSGAGSVKTKTFTSNNTTYTQTSSGLGAFAEGISTTASGTGSHAEGFVSISAGNYSHAEGYNTISTGDNSHTEGYQTRASYSSSHAEGHITAAYGSYSHSEGARTTANGTASHAEGFATISNGATSHVSGKYNVADSHDSWPEWVANTSYSVDDKVKRTITQNNETTVTGYKCKEANSDAEFTDSKWSTDLYMNYVEIIGNGISTDLSNARALDWDGNEYLAGNIYVGCNADSTGGVRVPHDVQVNGTSVVNNGVANIPIASPTAFGVVKTDANSFGIKINTEGRLYTDTPNLTEIKAGTQAYKPIVPATQHSAAFYGLAKAAGDTTQSASSNAVGTYTVEAKAAIQSMLGIQSSVCLTESVTGTTPSITAVPNVKYICGEVTTISITPPANGTCDVIFTSGSTATILTVPNTVKWPVWFDATSLETDTIYELMITDATYGSVMTWAAT